VKGRQEAEKKAQKGAASNYRGGRSEGKKQQKNADYAG